MFKNYLLTSFRNLMRNRFSSLLNIFGLAAGLASCMFIFLYVSDELSFDTGFEKSDRIYRIQAFYKFEDVEDKFGITPFPTVPTLLKDYPDISEGTRIFTFSQQFFKIDEQTYESKNTYLADSNFFAVFDFPFVYGNPDQALINPESVVLTLTDAEKIFGKTDPVGKTLKWNDHILKVTGVIDEKVLNTHIEMGSFISMNTASPQFMEAYQDNWGNNNCYSYVVVEEGVTKDDLQPKLDELVKKYALPQWQSFGFNGSIKMFAEPLADIHFNNYLIYDTSKKGNLSYVYIFSVVAIITLLIAAINFINMSLAGATKRAKEVGLRKVMGADRKKIITQFLGETFLVTLFASLLAMAFLELLMPAFNSITGKEITASSLFTGNFIIIFLLLIVFISFVAGSYPAFYISRMPIQSIFRDMKNVMGGSGILRKVLVSFQFTISIFMIIATLSILNQLNYMRGKELGFSKENMMAVTLPAGDSTMVQPLASLKQEVKKLSFVNNASRSANIPGQEISRFVFKIRTANGKEDKPTAVMFTDSDFLQMMRMNLSQGRLFTEEDASKPFGAALVNEAAVRSFGWKNPLEEKIIIPGDEQNPEQEIQVIGVISDFHFASLHHPIEPLVIGQQNPNGTAGNLIIEMNTDDIESSIKVIETEWKKIFPTKPFEYAFIDDNFKKMYEAEEKMFDIFIFFSVLAIVLSLLGLYALSVFTAQQRMKEIGIRKVMGASASKILILLNKDFVQLILVSVVISFPLSWYAITNWLEEFAYKAPINMMFFVLAAFFTLMLTVIAVSLHAMSTALRNPLNSIRQE